MKHLICPVVIIISASFVGCAKPCFYQAGKSVEQCKHDLRQCIDQARGQQKSESSELTRSCMQAKGYECLDASKISQDAKRVVVVAPFETYRVLDGLSEARSSMAVAEVKPQESIPQSPAARQIGYRARQDASGRYVITPVYEHKEKEGTDSPGLANSGK